MGHRVGFIGFGGMGSGYHFQTLRDRAEIIGPDITPVAVYDVREEQRKFATDNGLKAYDNLEDFLKSDDFDFVVVATPNNFHCEMTCKALEAGKDVICEKPVAMNLHEFDKMVDTAKKTGRHFFVHQNRRNDVDFLTVKHAIETGRVGKVNTIESVFTGGYVFEWRTFKDHGGGLVFDWGVHLIDQLIYLLNKRPVKVTGRMLMDCTVEVEDRAYIEMTFDDGVVARVILSTRFTMPNPRFTVFGNGGFLTIDKIYDNTGILHETENRHWETMNYIGYNENGPYQREQQMFRFNMVEKNYPDDGFSVPQDWAIQYKQIFDCIDLGTEMPVPYWQVRTVLQIIEAAQESSRTGMPVYI